jgi:hypothetical protein
VNHGKYLKKFTSFCMGDKMMKRTLTFLGLLMFLGAAAFAQGHMDANERDVRIVEGPSIINVTGHSARIEWVTNSPGANHVVYRVAGSNQEWQSAYHQGGGTRHFLELNNLEPGRTYEWKILTQDGDVRKTGQFQTEGHGRHGQNGGYGGRVPLYRSVNGTGAHFYSTNQNDQSRQDFRADGSSGFIMGTQRGGTLPLYRMSSANGDFLLTADVNEIPRMQASGYRNEGVIGFIATAQEPGTVPFYRLVNADGSAHFFTASPQERDQALRSGSWQEEGVTGYIWVQ